MGWSAYVFVRIVIRRCRKPAEQAVPPLVNIIAGSFLSFALFRNCQT